MLSLHLQWGRRWKARDEEKSFHDACKVVSVENTYWCNLLIFVAVICVLVSRLLL